MEGHDVLRLRLTVQRLTLLSIILDENIGLCVWRYVDERQTNSAQEKYERGITCQVAAFRVIDPPEDPIVPTSTWIAVATCQLYDPEIEVASLTPAQVVLTGETVRTISGKASSNSEAKAMRLAINALLFELTAKGYSDNQDVELW